MTAGFPTDDPWGDRQQGTPLPDFAAILARGVRPAWAPGTRFEYSNLGYAVLGRVIAAVAQADYADFVRDRLLGPLAMTRTGFEAAEFDPAGLARGYARGPGGWTEVAPDRYGAFAPMGGVFSSVRDLARWVNGFAAAFPPGGQRGGDAHPLAPATRREMQQPAVVLPEARPRFPGNPAAGSQYGYGFGLFTEETSAWGRLVYHSGGYPGFGSHMRWHPETGLGVVVLANSTYAGASVLAARLMEEVLKAAAAEGGPTRGRSACGRAGSGPNPGSGPRPAPAPGGPWPETLSAQQVVTGLLTHWDDEVAEQLFADNVALDQPLDRRRERIGRMWERLGPPRPRTQAAPAGRVRLPRALPLVAARRTRRHAGRDPAHAAEPARVQSLAVTMPPADDSALWRQTQALIALLNSSLTDSESRWPAELPVSGLVNTGLLLRQLRMARAWAGACQARGVLRRQRADQHRDRARRRARRAHPGRGAGPGAAVHPPGGHRAARLSRPAQPTQLSRARLNGPRSTGPAQPRSGCWLSRKRSTSPRITVAIEKPCSPHQARSRACWSAENRTGTICWADDDEPRTSSATTAAPHSRVCVWTPCGRPSSQPSRRASGPGTAVRDDRNPVRSSQAYTRSRSAGGSCPTA